MITAGNDSHNRIRIGTINANYGKVFLNDGRGGFNYMPQNQSGLQLRGDVRGLRVVDSKLVVGINSRPFQVYSFPGGGAVQ